MVDVDPRHDGTESLAALTPLQLSDFLLWGQIKAAGIADKLVRGLLGEQSFAVIAGPTGSGKTFLALDMRDSSHSNE